MKVLQKLLEDFGDKCSMDYPTERLEQYRAALDQARAANRQYTQWLAEQGIPFN